MKTIHILGIFLIATVGAGWAAMGPADGCGPALKISDPQLRAAFAQSDRSADYAQLCGLYRMSSITPNAPAR